MTGVINDKPLVSVIIPTYNRGEMLKECLDSLLYQTYPKDRYEIIVVNDGSTDEMEEVLRKCEEKATCKFKWFSQKNEGSYIARNLGVEKSIGEIICFIDDDCIADKDWITELVVSYNRSEIGGVGGRIIAYKTETLVERYSKENKFLEQNQEEAIFIQTANALYPMELLTKIRGFDHNLRIGGDVDISMRVKLLGYKLVYSPKAIVYHKHRTSLRGLMKQWFRYGRSYGLLGKKYTQNFHANKMILWTIHRIIFKIVIAPFKFLKILAQDEKRYNTTVFFLDIIVYSNYCLGTLYEKYLCRDYKGQRINEELGFIEKEIRPGCWGL